MAHDKSPTFRITGPYKRYPSYGSCIYCGSTKELSDEHIIPFFLGGNVVLPDASCGSCAKITSKFERICANSMTHPLRARMNLQTRRRKKRPKEFTIPVHNPDGTFQTIVFPARSVPFVCVGMKLDSARMPMGLPLSDRVTGELFAVVGDGDWTESLEPNQAALIGAFKIEPFGQLIAKIGHAHVMAALASDGVRPDPTDLFLPDIILGKSGHFQHYVGGDTLPLDRPNVLHQLRFNRYLPLDSKDLGDRKFMVSTVRLFALFGMPRYHVIVCYEPHKSGGAIKP
jgi:hypothetical protein